MKTGFRQSMAEVHTWSGLVLGWLLFFMFVTGASGYFDSELDLWMRPELPPAQQIASLQALNQAEPYLQQQAAGAKRWFISLPVDRSTPYTRVFWQGTKPGNAQLDPESGAPLQARATGGGQTLYRMHWRLHYLPEQVAEWIVGIASMFMLIALITGVVVHKKIFADFFTFRPGKGQRSWLDAHNVLGVVSLPFHLMITYSGLLFLMSTLMPLILAAYYGLSDAGQKRYFDELSGRGALTVPASGTPMPLTALNPLLQQAQARWGLEQVQYIDVQNPGDAKARVSVRQKQQGPLRNAESMLFDGVTGELLQSQPAIQSGSKAVQEVLLGLHEGLFAGPWLRALYFISGLVGALMVATGLVLWTVKRRLRAEKSGNASRGLLLVERLNLGVILGLPIAIAGYFWANRLLPTDLANRANWEVHCLFLVWAALLAHAAWRPIARGWWEQALLACAAFGLLPVLNALTTERHLLTSLSQQDWPRAGFDLTVWVLSALFGALVWALRARKKLT